VKRLGLRGRFLAISIPLTAVLVAIILGGSYIGFSKRVREETHVRASILKSALAKSNNLELACGSGNRGMALEQVQRHARLDPEHVDYIIVVDDRGEVLAEHRDQAFRGNAQTTVEELIRNHDRPVTGWLSIVERKREPVHLGRKKAAQEEEVEPEMAWLGGAEETADTDDDTERQQVGEVLLSIDGSDAFRRTLIPLAIAGVLIPSAFLIAISLLFTAMFRRIRNMVDFARTVATGDLAQTMPVSSEDELGRLAGALNQMTQNLSNVLARVARVAAELGLVIELINESATGLTQGSERQWSSLEQTRGELDEMARSLRETARNVEAISRWAKESASDAKAIGDRNTEVSGDLDRLRGAIDSMSSSVEQVGQNISSLARHVDVLSQAAGETESTINRTEQALQSVRLFADSSSQIAERVSTEARAGAVSVAGSLSSINKLETVMGDVRNATSGLTDRLGLVATLLQAISDVARRTNLLSLNAAIIASQAGEHGRQFQVVAEEVKALAGQTSGLTRDIERVLEEIAGAGEQAQSTVMGASETVAEGVTQAHKAGTVLDSILDAAAQSAQMSQEIAESIAEREGDLNRVNQAMERVVNVTSDIRGVTRSQVRAAELMRDAARTISEVGDAVGQSTEQQMEGSARISRALADVSESVARLSNTQGEQAKGGDRILGAVEEVRSVANKSRGEARAVEQTLEVLVRQAGELRAELDRFVLDPATLSAHIPRGDSIIQQR